MEFPLLILNADLFPPIFFSWIMQLNELKSGRLMVVALGLLFLKKKTTRQK